MLTIAIALTATASGATLDASYLGPERVITAATGQIVVVDPTLATPRVVRRITQTTPAAASVECGRRHLLLLGRADGTDGWITRIDPATGAAASEVEVKTGKVITAALELDDALLAAVWGGPIAVLGADGSRRPIDVGGLVHGTPVVGGLTTDGTHVYAVVTGMEAGRPIDAAALRIDLATASVVNHTPLTTRHALREPMWQESKHAVPLGFYAGDLIVSGGRWNVSAEHTAETQFERVDLDWFRSWGLIEREPVDYSGQWLGATIDRSSNPVFLDASAVLHVHDLATGLTTTTGPMASDMDVGLIQGGPMEIDARGNLWVGGAYIQFTFFNGLVMVDTTAQEAVWSIKLPTDPVDLAVCRR